MDNLICQECKVLFDSLKSLHLHLRLHKISQVEYYQKHFPRYDQFDGFIIKFKSLDFYLNSDFNSRLNAIKWLKKVPNNQAIEYIRKFLLERKAKKGLRFLPSQVELRSLPMGGIKLLNEITGDYLSFGKEIGLSSRFSSIEFDGNWNKFSKKHRIIVDTREQKPLSFSIPTISEGLMFGDYILNDILFSYDCHIERKSLGDFYTTLSLGFNRFLREINKAKGSYLVVVIEEPMEEVYNFIYRHQVAGKTRISPEFVLHNMREIIQNNQFLQFLFVNDRQDAAKAIERIFCSNGQFRNVDLQYLYDIGNLI